MKLRNINKIYHNKHNDVQALNCVNLDIDEYGFVSILGPSGSGKTTLLHIISGQDKDYNGCMENQGQVEIIEQEFILAESMTVFDNLALVSSNIEEIKSYLTTVGLQGYLYKKVKFLSNGQKKRVQVIRSLLFHPNYLLCDEPTASLDFENAVIIMELLKNESKKCSVIVVTHDIAFANKYADRLITFDKGQIINDKTINNYSIININDKQKNKNIIEHLKMVIKYLFSRPFEYFSMLGLSFLIVMLLFFSFNLFDTIQTNTMIKESWKYGDNIISSEPKKSVEAESGSLAAENEYGNIYLEYDNYQLDSVYLVKQYVNGIIGYSVGWNFDKYTSKTNDQNRQYYEFCKQFQKIGNVQNGVFIQNEIATPMIRFNNDYNQRLSYQSQKNATFYEIFEGCELPLQYGCMPKQYNEVVLSQDIAIYLAKIYGYSSIELLLNQYVDIPVDTMLSRHTDEDLINNYNYQIKEEDYLIKLKVVGISLYENQNEGQLYLKETAYQRWLTDNLKVDKSMMAFHYINFLTDSSYDSQLISEEINQVLKSENNHFKVTNKSQFEYLSTNENYQNPKIVYSYSFVAFIIVIGLYFSIRLIISKRIQKELSIFNHYGYSVIVIIMVQYFVLFIVIGILAYLCIPSVCYYINQYAHQFMYNSIMEFNVRWLLFSLVISCSLMFMGEGVIYAFRTKKYK